MLPVQGRLRSPHKLAEIHSYLPTIAQAGHPEFEIHHVTALLYNSKLQDMCLEHNCIITWIRLTWASQSSFLSFWTLGKSAAEVSPGIRPSSSSNFSTTESQKGYLWSDFWIHRIPSFLFPHILDSTLYINLRCESFSKDEYWGVSIET